MGIGLVFDMFLFTFADSVYQCIITYKKEQHVQDHTTSQREVCAARAHVHVYTHVHE